MKIQTQLYAFTGRKHAWRDAEMYNIIHKLIKFAYIQILYVKLKRRIVPNIVINIYHYLMVYSKLLYTNWSRDKAAFCLIKAVNPQTWRRHVPFQLYVILLSSPIHYDNQYVIDNKNYMQEHA